MSVATDNIPLTIEQKTRSSTTMSSDFPGQRALVTGGTSGIGFGIAQAFADAGVDVTATGVSEVSAVEAAAR